MARQKLKRAYISVNYASHADIVSLTAHHGIQGKCASYDLNLIMSGASNGIIDKKTFIYTAKQNEVENPEAFLTFCIEKGIFIEIDGGYSNTYVIKDQESYSEKLRKDRERKRNEDGIPPESERNPSGNEVELPRTLDIDIDNNIKNKEPPSDNSPEAPKWLRRKPEQLEPIPKNANGIPQIWLTAKELNVLYERFGTEQIHYQIRDFATWGTENPKAFKQKTDHYLTLIKWIKSKKEKGLSWCKHPSDGYGYYPHYIVEKLKAEAPR